MPPAAAGFAGMAAGFAGMAAGFAGIAAGACCWAGIDDGCSRPLGQGLGKLLIHLDSHQTHLTPNPNPRPDRTHIEQILDGSVWVAISCLQCHLSEQD